MSGLEQYSGVLTQISIAIGVIIALATIVSKLKVWLKTSSAAAVLEVKDDNKQVGDKLNLQLELTHGCIQRLEQQLASIDDVSKRDVDDVRVQLNAIRNQLDARTPFFERLFTELDEVADRLTKIEMAQMAHEQSDTQEFYTIGDALRQLKLMREAR